MKIRKRIEIVLMMVAAVTVAACSSSQPVVDPVVRLAYESDPSAANLESLAKAYGSVINKSRKTGMKQSGIYSDYAVALVSMGRREEANGWFNKEINEFPASRQYVLQLKKILIPEYQNDNSTDVKEAMTEEDNDKE